MLCILASHPLVRPQPARILAPACGKILGGPRPNRASWVETRSVSEGSARLLAYASGFDGRRLCLPGNPAAPPCPPKRSRPRREAHTFGRRKVHVERVGR